MKVKEIPSKWIYREGLRLDGKPYMSGALEAREILEALSDTEPLKNFTDGHDGGIYNGPKFSRIWVSEPIHGVPFLGSSSMLMSDLSNLPLLQRKYAESPKLSHLRLKKGTTLISCSGTIGKMVYSRLDMEDMWTSQHIMKIVPNESKIRPGYLYAFLSGKFGVPLIISGTYGAIIQHIEPHHVSSLPVPRIGSGVEEKVHELVESASQKRTVSLELLEKSQSLLRQVFNFPEIENRESIWTAQSATSLNRFDAFYFSEANKIARSIFDSSNCLLALKKVSDVYIPNIFKRRYADDPNYGYPYITGADVFELAPTSDRFLMKTVAEENQLVLRKGMILIQEAGQLSGLIGRSVQVGSYLDGFACTNNMVRVTPNEPEDRGYLFTVLASEYGVRLIQREAAGSSIPHIEVSRVQNLEIPWPAREIRRKIGQPAMKAQDLRDAACELENQARELVEKAIEEAAA